MNAEMSGEKKFLSDRWTESTFVYPWIQAWGSKLDGKVWGQETVFSVPFIGEEVGKNQQLPRNIYCRFISLCCHFLHTESDCLVLSCV
jgi:hypothetical protein